MKSKKRYTITSALPYTNGRLHFSTISTAESVELIKNAKEKGLNVTADVCSYHLLLSDTKLEGFNSDLKVFCFLRSQWFLYSFRYEFF